MQIALAPMEGLVDELMRDLLTRVGGVDWCVTEFIRVCDRLLPESQFLKLAPELARGSRTAAARPCVCSCWVPIPPVSPTTPPSPVRWARRSSI